MHLQFKPPRQKSRFPAFNQSNWVERCLKASYVIKLNRNASPESASQSVCSEQRPCSNDGKQRMICARQQASTRPASKLELSLHSEPTSICKPQRPVDTTRLCSLDPAICAVLSCTGFRKPLDSIAACRPRHFVLKSADN